MASTLILAEAQESVESDDIAKLAIATIGCQARAIRGRVEPAQISAAAFIPLRHREFRYPWAGTVLLSAGQWIHQVTLGRLLRDMIGSSVLLGALTGLRLALSKSRSDSQTERILLRKEDPRKNRL